MENNGNSGEKSQIGRHGEDLVCRFLMESGHCILERNFRSGHLEIDIITLDRNGIHFVEVKTRRAPVSGNVSESVGPVKQRRLAAAAARYLRQHRWDGECFFDVATVVFRGRDTEIRYIPEAFVPVFL